MKQVKHTIFALGCAAAVFFFPLQAQAMGWENVPDGYTYQDSDGCIHHVHTQEWNLFGITWSRRTVDDTVACPE